jgi:hypothetical protein
MQMLRSKPWIRSVRSYVLYLYFLACYRRKCDCSPYYLPAAFAVGAVLKKKEPLLRKKYPNTKSENLHGFFLLVGWISYF